MTARYNFIKLWKWFKYNIFFTCVTLQIICKLSDLPGKEATPEMDDGANGFTDYKASNTLNYDEYNSFDSLILY